MKISIFSVLPDPRHGWRVSVEGGQQSYFFVDKKLALDYVSDWAEANTPSRVVVSDRSGCPEKAWEYQSQ
jgi:hypothetical protein